MKNIPTFEDFLNESTDPLNEAIKITNSLGDESTIDTALIDKLIKQIGPVTGYTDWKEKAKKVDYADIIEKIAKSLSGLGPLQNSNISIKK